MRYLRPDAPIIAHADGDDELKRARAARFRAEAKKPPPPLPTKRIAWAGGKIATNSKDACLRKLLERKMANGETLTPEQMQAAAALQPASVADVNVASLTTRTVIVKKQKQQQQQQQQQQSPPPPKQQQPRQQQQQQQHSVQSAEPTALPQRAQPANQPAVCPEKRKLLKKLREIEELEGKLAAGLPLEANQAAKVQGKPEVLAKLETLA